LERNELVVVLLLVLISMAIGFGVFSVFFHPLTAEVRVRFKGGSKKATRWLRAHAKRAVLILVLALAGLALILLGIRYGGAIAKRVSDLLSSKKSEEVTPEPQTQSLEPPGAAVENVAPEAQGSTAPAVTQPQAPAIQQPAQQPAAAAGEPPPVPTGELPAGEPPLQ
jgi:hypothetical protein